MAAGPDGGTGNVGQADSGELDGGLTDGGLPDSGIPDGGPPVGSVLAERYTVTIIAPPSPDIFAVPTGMAPDGTIVGYTGTEAWGPVSRPIRVLPGATTAEVLDVPEADNGFAHGGASSGLIAGEFKWEPHVWTDQGTQKLPVPDGYFSGSAWGASASGVVVGSFADRDDALPPNPVGPRPCAWKGSPRVAVPLALLESTSVNGAALAVNAAGRIVGWVAVSAGVTAVTWENEDAQPVAIVPAQDAVLSEARAVSSGGDIAGRVSLPDNSSHAWRLKSGATAPELLVHLPGGGPYAEAFGINKWGHVVGAASAGVGAAHAVAWDDSGIVDLNDRLTELPAGVRHLSSAVAISDEGRIVAEAVMDSGFGDSIRHIAILEPAP